MGRKQTNPSPKRRSTPKKNNAGEDISLSESAYRAIEERIVRLDFAPGQLISEALLSKQLGIGRTPIREALQRLAQERLVVIMPRRGIFVAEINVTRQLRLLELRRGLERLLAKCAAKRSTDTERQQFREVAAGMNAAAEKSDDVSFMRLDRQFNDLLATAARNEFASSAIGLVSGLARRFWYMHYRQIANLPLTSRLHAKVALAVAAGDEAKAEKASDALLDYIEQFTRATLDVTE